jgi:tripeptidyl-peptidase-1
MSTGTKYNVYHNPKASEYVVRTLSYSLPSILLGHVDVVSPTTYFGTLRSLKTTNFLQPDIKPIESDVNGVINGVNAANCATRVTPACLRALYRTSKYVPKATDKNILGIAGYLKEWANYADLQVCTSTGPWTLAFLTFF